MLLTSLNVHLARQTESRLVLGTTPDTTEDYSKPVKKPNIVSDVVAQHVHQIYRKGSET